MLLSFVFRMDDDWLEIDRPAAPAEPAPVPQPAAAPAPVRAAKPVVLRDPPPSALQTTDGASYFFVRGNPHAISSAMENAAWEFPANTRFETSVNFSFLSRPHVLFIFASGDKIHGYARMSTLAAPRKRNRERSEIEIVWFRKAQLNVSEIDNLRNSLNGNRPVRNAADGEELAPAAGRAICRLLDRISFNEDPVAYKPERELLPPARQKKLARRFQDTDELKLLNCSFEDFKQIWTSRESAGLPLPSRRFRKL